MTEHRCTRTILSIREGRFCMMMPPDPDWCCCKPAPFVRPGAPDNRRLCAECYDDWMKGDCLA